MSDVRYPSELIFTILDAATVSDAKYVGHGVQGILLVPTGSTLVGKTMQCLAHSPDGLYADTPLLAAGKVLAAGANPFTATELLALAGAKHLKLSVTVAVTGDATCTLLWKS